MNKLKSVHIDGALYVGIAAFGSLQAAMTSDTITKLINPLVLWSLQTIVAVGLASCSALKMYRSTAYSESKKTNGSNGNTEIITK